MTTRIEWTDETWNPVTGCAKVSAGCKNCYAERIAQRFWGERKFTDVICHEDRLDIPLHWRKPLRVFVNSMSDLFHPDVSIEFIRKVYKTMWAADRHTYQILTKRPDRANEILQDKFFVDGSKIYGHNIWLGVSVENQETADERIPLLIKTPAVVRFVSYEPALGPVDFDSHLYIHDLNTFGKGLKTGDFSCHPGNKLDWIIAGGESGPGARPAHPDWFRSVRDQCIEAGVPFFLKQMVVNGKMVKMPELDGRVWNEYPEAAR